MRNNYRRRKATPLGSVLKNVLKNRGLEKRYLYDEALRLWDKSVTPYMSAHTHPICVEKGQMVISVDDPVIRQEIHFGSIDIISRINDQLGRKIISGIVLR